MNKENDEMLGEQLKLIFSLIIALDIGRLNEIKEKWQDDISRYEAIGTIDGHSYFDRLNDMRARYKRLSATISLIDVFMETQNNIKSNSELGESCFLNLVKERSI